MKTVDELTEFRDALQLALVAAREKGGTFEDWRDYQTVKCTLDWILGNGSATEDFNAFIEKVRPVLVRALNSSRRSAQTRA